MTKTTHSQETNLKSIQDEAVSLLYLPIELDPSYPMFAHHPYTNSRFIALPDITGKAVIADLCDEEALIRWQSAKEDMISKCQNVSSVFLLIDKPYRLALLKMVEPYLSIDDLSQILRFVWRTTEFPNTDMNIRKKHLCKLFAACDPAKLMTPEELRVLEQLPDTVRIYRGVGSGLKKDISALSWTLNPDKAAWFAFRFDSKHQQGIVWETDIAKSDILAYFDVGGEDEIVVPPQKLGKILKKEN